MKKNTCIYREEQILNSVYDEDKRTLRTSEPVLCWDRFEKDSSDPLIDSFLYYKDDVLVETINIVYSDLEKCNITGGFLVSV